MRVHLLTDGFSSPNGRAFLFPLLVWRDALHEAGIDLHLWRRESAALTDADLLIIDSKIHRHRWATGESQLLETYAGWRDRCPVIFYDNSDSAGWLLHQALPVVDGYFKNQLLTDRRLYGRPLYGRRYHSDFYHRLAGIEDAQPEWGTPVTEPVLLNKLRLGWNSGLADYSMHGPARMALFARLPLPGLLRFARQLAPANSPRTQDLSCRFGSGYARRSVAWQRRQLRQLLGARCATAKLGRRPYYRELCRSTIVASPFGLGEITLKDFEVFLSGALLLKPDMSHMQTWPDFYRQDETCVMHRLDLEDLEQRIDDFLNDRQSALEIAERGQACYLHYTRGPQAAELFSNHLQELLGPFLRNG